MGETLKRYTQLPFLIDMLETKALALLSPSSWDDQNDAYYLKVYQRRSGFPSVLALCLTESSTTYHHWKIFAGSTSGVCVEFHRKPFIDWAKKNGIECKPVEYLSIRRGSLNLPTDKDLPFRKRHAFRDEGEVRLLFRSQESCVIKTFPLDLGMIEHIEVNPWLPDKVFESVRKSILGTPECRSLKVRHSHMLTNVKWAGLADSDNSPTPQPRAPGSPKS